MPLRLVPVITRPGQVLKREQQAPRRRGRGASAGVAVSGYPGEGGDVQPDSAGSGRAVIIAGGINGPVADRPGGAAFIAASWRGGGRPQPWAAGRWSVPVTVMHQVERGLRAAAAARSRASAGSMGPIPSISPG